MYTDEKLTCTDCGAEFTFTSGEQEFFASKGFQNKPNRCPDCRAARKATRGTTGAGAGAGSAGGSSRSGGYSSGGGGGSYAGGGGGGAGGGGGGGAREMFSVTCSSCGQTAEVPFQPRGDKPVYCRDCFARTRSASSSYR